MIHSLSLAIMRLLYGSGTCGFLESFFSMRELKKLHDKTVQNLEGVEHEPLEQVELLGELPFVLRVELCEGTRAPATKQSQSYKSV